VPTGPQSTVSPSLDQEARRLLWRCRRGMKELDVLLERFARRELPGSTSEQRQTLARFLELPDPELVDYLLGQAIPPDPELARLVQRIAEPAAPDPAPVRPPETMAVVHPVRHDLASKSRP
jgi:antitoxin CptB